MKRSESVKENKEIDRKKKRDQFLTLSHLRRYFTSFMNLVHSLNSVDVSKLNQIRKQAVQRHIVALREATILAMSNMLTANIDSGLTHAIGTVLYVVHVRFGLQ